MYSREPGVPRNKSDGLRAWRTRPKGVRPSPDTAGSYCRAGAAAPSSSKADYQAVLRTLKYQNDSENPTAGPRTINLTVPLSWIAALSSSRGVYLLTCPKTREQYVGSATGIGGFYGRWLSYIRDGQGGNVGLPPASTCCSSSSRNSSGICPDFWVSKS